MNLGEAIKFEEEFIWGIVGLNTFTFDFPLNTLVIKDEITVFIGDIDTEAISLKSPST